MPYSFPPAGGSSRASFALPLIRAGAAGANKPMLSGIGPTELIIVLVLALLILGPKKLPEVGRSVGRGMREFKESIGGRDSDDEPDEIPAVASARVADAPVAAAAPERAAA